MPADRLRISYIGSIKYEPIAYERKMDKTTFDSLRAALKGSPDNRELARVLLRAALEHAEPDDLRELLSDLQTFASAATNEQDGRELARAHLALNEPAAALKLLNGSESETLLLRARAHCALGDMETGREAYRRAVALNPALEDRALSAELDSKVIRLDAARGGALRKIANIANDDTDDTEVVRLLHPETQRITFSDVGGLADIKKQIHRRIILPFQKPSLFQRFKRTAGGGILLYGPPGCGKTLIARATAGECGAKFFNVAVSDILDMYIGESERKLHALFEQARRSSPAVMFFDEVEALGGKRQHTREATSSKLVSQFLSELDGFAQNNHNVLVMGATNVPWAVDPAFRRPGRFDRVMFVPPPDRPARLSILESLVRDRPTEGDLGLADIADITSGFSGADLRDLMDSAVDEAIEASVAEGREVPLRHEHLRAALRAAKPTTSEWLTTARNYARYANEGGQYDEVLVFLDKHAKRR
jgi:SpoVK/Ycf46/Vps4 family AAA+-type ATPase